MSRLCFQNLSSPEFVIMKHYQSDNSIHNFLSIIFSSPLRYELCVTHLLLCFHIFKISFVILII